MSNSSDRKPGQAKFANSNLNAVFAPKGDGTRSSGVAGRVLLLAPKVGLLRPFSWPQQLDQLFRYAFASAAAVLSLAWSMPPLRLLIIALQVAY